MEKLITYEDARLFFTNEATLVHAFLSGRVLAYDKNTLVPINGKVIRTFFQELAEIFETPVVYLVPELKLKNDDKSRCCHHNQHMKKARA